MNHIQNILIPTDFGETAFNTVKYGVELAKKYDCNIELIHVIDVTYYGSTYTTAGDIRTVPVVTKEIRVAKEKAAKTSIDKLNEKIASHFKDLPKIKNVIRSGIESDAVIEEIKENNIDLLLLSASSEKGFLQFITDDNRRLVEKAPCPVIVVPEDAEFGAYKKIVYATDYSSKDIPTMKKLVKYAKPTNANIIALHITDDSSFNEQIKNVGFEENMKKEVEYDHISAYARMGMDVVKSTLTFAEDAGADLIVYLKENKGFLEKIFEGSTTKKVIKKTPLPVLIFHEE